MEVVASLSQGRTAAGQCGLFTYKSVPVIFEPPCITEIYMKVHSALESYGCRFIPKATYCASTFFHRHTAPMEGVKEFRTYYF